MKRYKEMTGDELKQEYEHVKAKYEELCLKGLSLDMSRGKPGPDQLGISNDVLDMVNSKQGFTSRDGVDCRNYGGLDGLS